MRRYQRLLLGLLFLLGSATLASATGPSSADFKIIPIGHNDKGVILCKTYYSVNVTGAHYYQKAEFGWLVVSANGSWIEALHRVFDPEKVPEDEHTTKWDQYHEEFQKDFSWASPPLSVRPLLRRYRFVKHRGFSQDTGAGLLTWEPERVCQRGACTSGETAQRSLHNLRSRKGRGSRVSSSFYYAGVAVFNNFVEDDDKSQGAEYFIPIRPADSRAIDPGIDYWNIDGIVIRKSKPKAKRNR